MPQTFARLDSLGAQTLSEVTPAQVKMFFGFLFLAFVFWLLSRGEAKQ